MYYVGSMPVGPNDIQHFGILGMKWGVRRYRNEDGSLTDAGKARYSRQLQKEASKDAKRYADAKMYYGEGAGTRRKLLKAELDKKRKSSQEYSKYLDDAINNADYYKSAKKAKAERTARDTASTVKRTTKKVMKVAVPIAVTAGGIYYAANKAKVDSFILKTMDSTVKNAKNYVWKKRFLNF